MKISTTSNTVTRLVGVDVSDVPDVDISREYHRKTGQALIFRPQRAVIRVVDGHFREVRVSGPQVLKSGKPSAEFRDGQTWYRDADDWREDRLSGAPEWVQQLVAHVIART